MHVNGKMMSCETIPGIGGEVNSIYLMYLKMPPYTPTQHNKNEKQKK
jgi:hypothetical protein